MAGWLVWAALAVAASARAQDPVDLPAAAAGIVAEDGRSESVGTPQFGYIEGDVQIAPHAAYVLREPSRSYVTRRTADRIRAAFDAVLAADRRAPRVIVLDASLRGGGPINGHLSHESGRDVDITYYQRHGCELAVCPVRRIAPADLDAGRTWRLIRHWLARGQVRAIYVDFALQAPLVREARRTGATEAQIATWFQYPHGRAVERGIVRHFPNHVDHMHVRFSCHASERRCE